MFQDIHDGLGHAKIKDCFLVNIDFKNQSFIVKALKCLSSFINKDFSAKPYNHINIKPVWKFYCTKEKWVSFIQRSEV